MRHSLRRQIWLAAAHQQVFSRLLGKPRRLRRLRLTHAWIPFGLLGVSEQPAQKKSQKTRNTPKSKTCTKTLKELMDERDNRPMCLTKKYFLFGGWEGGELDKERERRRKRHKVLKVGKLLTIIM